MLVYVIGIRVPHFLHLTDAHIVADVDIVLSAELGYSAGRLSKQCRSPMRSGQGSNTAL